jgi:hypothetical protein
MHSQETNIFQETEWSNIIRTILGKLLTMLSKVLKQSGLWE